MLCQVEEEFGKAFVYLVYITWWHAMGCKVCESGLSNSESLSHKIGAIFIDTRILSFLTTERLFAGHS